MPAVEVLTDSFAGANTADIEGRVIESGTWNRVTFYDHGNRLGLLANALVESGGDDFWESVYTAQGCTALPATHYVTTLGRFISADAESGFGPVANQDATTVDGYEALLYGDGTVRLWRAQSVVAQTDVTTDVTVVVGQTHAVKLCIGDLDDGRRVVKVFVDDELVLCYLDEAGFTTGDPGVGVLDFSGTFGAYVEVVGWSAGTGCAADLVQINGLQPRKNGAFRPEPTPSVRARGAWRPCGNMWEWANGAWRPLFAGAADAEPRNNCYRQYLDRAIYGLQYTTASSPTARLYGPDGASVAATIMTDALSTAWGNSTVTALHDGGIVNHKPRAGSIFGSSTALRSFIPGSLSSGSPGVNVVTAAASTPAVESLTTPDAPFAVTSLGPGRWFASYGVPVTPGDMPAALPYGQSEWYGVLWVQSPGFLTGEVSITIGSGGTTVTAFGRFLTDGGNWQVGGTGAITTSFTPGSTEYPLEAREPSLGGVYVANWLAVRMTGATTAQIQYGSVTQFPGMAAYGPGTPTHSTIAHVSLSAGGVAADPLTVHYDFDPALGTGLDLGAIVETTDTEDARLIVGAADGSALWVYAPPVGGAISGYTLERTIDMTPHTAIRGMYEDKTRGCIYVLADDDLLRIDPRTGATVLALDLGAGSEPFEIIEHSNQSLYITCTGTDEVVVVDQINWAVSDRIAVGSQPHGIGWQDNTVLSGLPDYIYCANTGDDTVSEIDPDTNTVTRTIAVDAEPWGILPYGDNGRRMRVGHVAGQTVVAIV